MSDPGTLSDASLSRLTEVEKIEQRLERERRARLEAERIARDVITRLADARDELMERTRALEQMMEHMEGLNRLRQDLVNNVSHVLQTPLTSLLMRLHVAARAAGEKQERAIEEAQRSARELSAAMADLVRIAQIDAGLVLQEISDVDVPDVVRRVMADLAVRGSGEVNVAAPVLGDDHVTTMADPSLVEDVVRLCIEMCSIGAKGVREVHIHRRGPEVEVAFAHHGRAVLETRVSGSLVWRPSVLQEGLLGLKWLQAAGLLRALRGKLEYDPAFRAGPAFVCTLAAMSRASQKGD